MKPKKHTVNWNMITLIITIGGIIISIVLNYNRRELDILHSQLDKIEKEKSEIENQIDPEWHKKFNNQKNYYENELWFDICI